jgi:hypothetical protein
VIAWTARSNIAYRFPAAIRDYILVEKLKHTKNTLIEQNRALKEILKAERF